METTQSTEELRRTAQQTAKTRNLMSTLFSSVAKDSFGASFAAALSDDLVWTVTGSSCIAGRYEGKANYLRKVLTPLRDVLQDMPIPIVDHVFVDRDWAIINWHSEGVRGKNGADYDMSYCWIMKVQDDKIVEVKGFYDGEKVSKVFKGYDFSKT